MKALVCIWFILAIGYGIHFYRKAKVEQVELDEAIHELAKMREADRLMREQNQRDNQQRMNEARMRQRQYADERLRQLQEEERRLKQQFAERLRNNKARVDARWEQYQQSKEQQQQYNHYASQQGASNFNGQWQQNSDAFWQQYHGQRQSQQQRTQTPSSYIDSKLIEAYKTLGVEHTVSEDVLKKAYRKLMSKYHPDKNVNRGLSESEMKKISERAQAINAAYELIMKSRG